MPDKRKGTCPICGKPITTCDHVAWVDNGARLVHYACLYGAEIGRYLTDKEDDTPSDPVFNVMEISDRYSIKDGCYVGSTCKLVSPHKLLERAERAERRALALWRAYRRLRKLFNEDVPGSSTGDHEEWLKLDAALEEKG